MYKGFLTLKFLSTKFVENIVMSGCGPRIKSQRKRRSCMGTLKSKELQFE